MPIGSLSSRPVVRRYGAMWIDWSERDYCQWFAETKNWLPSQTIEQPIGVLDALVDSAMQQYAAERRKEQERAKNRRVG